MKKRVPKKVGAAWETTKRDQYTVVLEDLRSQFMAFGETLSMTRESLEHRLDKVNIELAKINERLGNLEGRMQRVEERMQTVEERLTYLEHANLELLKEIRENTISRSEFEELRAKVRQLESRVTK